jgi:hypothetical protein
MLKRGEFNTSFQRRFFRFAETAAGLTFLVYYKNMEDDEPRGRVSLVCAQLVDSPDPPDQSSPLDFAGALLPCFVCVCVCVCMCVCVRFPFVFVGLHSV